MDGFSDVAFFSLLMRQGSLTGAAQELGISQPAVSRRLSNIEGRLGVRLLQRTTRRISLTPEGETYLTEGARVLAELEAMERLVSGSREQPRGLLKVGATLGFGRRLISPLLSRFAKTFPEVEVQLTLNDRPLNIVEQGLDVVVRFGELPDSRLTARLLALNHRILCASPTYLSQAGVPDAPKSLSQHKCLFIREGDEAYGTWQLRKGQTSESVKVRGPLTSNDGECVMRWALEGHGIMIRSVWDVAPAIRDGSLQEVLSDWSLPGADIYAVFATRNHLSAKTRAFVDFLLDEFAHHRNPDKLHW